MMIKTLFRLTEVKNVHYLFLLCSLMILGCKSTQEEKKSQKSPETIKEMVASAYFHFFPIVENYKAIYAFRVLKSSPKYGPMNQLTQESKLYTPADKFVVSPNNDTYYTTANLDLRAEPMVLKVPAVKDRYYSFQFVSLNTDNFAYIGTNSTGNEAGEYVITGPDFDGTLPQGLKEIKSPSAIIGIIGRTQVNVSDSMDILKAKEVQAAYSLTTLSETYTDFKPKVVQQIDFPEYSVEAMSDQRFFELLNFLLGYTDLSEDEQKILNGFEEIGISANEPYRFFADHPDLQKVILEGIQQGVKKVEDESRKLGTVQNGWTMYPLGEYFGSNYEDRTKVAKIGIYANSPFEAYYPIAFVDENGNSLMGSKSYKLVFEKGNLPPAKYFWSLTMYDGKTQLLVDNELQRYSIGDRTKNLKYEADGSLVIYFGAKSPRSGTSNWLPAPSGEFNVMMRIYGPAPAVLEGKWLPPAIVEVKE